MIAVGDDRDTAIGLHAGHPSGVVFKGQQASLAVAGQTVGAVGGFVEQRHTLARGPLHAAIIANVTQ